MKTSHRTTVAALLSTVILAVGCAMPGASPGLGQSYPAAATRDQTTSYGVIEGIDTVAPGAMSSAGVGTVGGAVVGGVLGNQVGSGSGRKAATIAGAIGGAIAGNQIDQRRNTAPAQVDVHVRMRDGSYQTFRQDSQGDLRVGQRVRIENGRLYRY